MKLPPFKRIKSAPSLLQHNDFKNIFEEVIANEVTSQIKKSASYQFLSEITQLTVNDFKTTNEIIKDFGNNANEIAQSSIDFIEDDNSNKGQYLIIRFALRLLIGSLVEYSHHLLEFIYNILQTFYLLHIEPFIHSIIIFISSFHI